MANERSDTLAAGRGVVISPIVGDIAPSIDSFRRHLRASNAAPRTISTYLEGATQFATFLAARAFPHTSPTSVGSTWRLRRGFEPLGTRRSSSASVEPRSRAAGAERPSPTSA